MFVVEKVKQPWKPAAKDPSKGKGSGKASLQKQYLTLVLKDTQELPTLMRRYRADECSRKENNVQKDLEVRKLVFVHSERRSIGEKHKKSQASYKIIKS